VERPLVAPNTKFIIIIVVVIGFFISLLILIIIISRRKLNNYGVDLDFNQNSENEDQFGSLADDERNLKSIDLIEKFMGNQHTDQEDERESSESREYGSDNDGSDIEYSQITD
jgi:hypothetical protein